MTLISMFKSFYRGSSLEAETPKDFGFETALFYLKHGRKVFRSSWKNGVNGDPFIRVVDDQKTIKIFFNGYKYRNWSLTQADLFANDWNLL